MNYGINVANKFGYLSDDEADGSDEALKKAIAKKNAKVAQAKKDAEEEAAAVAKVEASVVEAKRVEKQAKSPRGERGAPRRGRGGRGGQGNFKRDEDRQQQDRPARGGGRGRGSRGGRGRGDSAPHVHFGDVEVIEGDAKDVAESKPEFSGRGRGRGGRSGRGRGGPRNVGNRDEEGASAEAPVEEAAVVEEPAVPEEPREKTEEELQREAELEKQARQLTLSEFRAREAEQKATNDFAPARVIEVPANLVPLEKENADHPAEKSVQVVRKEPKKNLIDVNVVYTKRDTREAPRSRGPSNRSDDERRPRGPGFGRRSEENSENEPRAHGGARGGRGGRGDRGGSGGSGLRGGRGGGRGGRGTSSSDVANGKSFQMDENNFPSLSS